MTRRSLSYRLSTLLLAAALAPTGFGPVIAHVCGHDDPGAAMHEGMAHEGMHHTPSSQAEDHACCGDDCPARDAASEPAQATCCSPDAAAYTEAVAPPPAPRSDAAVAPAPAPPPGSAPALRPIRLPFDTGPPPPPVRSHLSLSVLLI